MALHKEFGKLFKTQLSKTAVFTSFPLSLLLIPIETLVDFKFTCPCDVKRNTTDSNLVFTAPGLFTLALMFVVLPPFKKPCSFKCQSEGNSRCYKIHNYKCLNIKEGSCCKSIDFKSCNCIWFNLKDFFVCLSPTFVWVILVLFDGSYVACLKSDWDGVYAFDDQLNVKWCKPNESVTGRNKTELRDLTLSFIADSKRNGYYAFTVFSLLIIIAVFYNVCYCCDNQLDNNTTDAHNVKLKIKLKVNNRTDVPSDDEQSQVNPFIDVSVNNMIYVPSGDGKSQVQPLRDLRDNNMTDVPSGDGQSQMQPLIEGDSSNAVIQSERETSI